jgi:hypothetical protein
VLAGENAKLAVMQLGTDKTHLDQQGRSNSTPLLIYSGNLCASLIKKGHCGPCGYFNIHGSFKKGADEGEAALLPSADPGHLRAHRRGV